MDEFISMYCMNRECDDYAKERGVRWNHKDEWGNYASVWKSSRDCPTCKRRMVTEDGLPNQEARRRWSQDVTEFYRSHLKQGYSAKEVNAMYHDFNRNHPYWKEVLA